MNIKDITQGPISSVAELIDLAKALDEQTALGRRWAYRGQPSDYGSLIPSFQREFSRQSYGTAALIERKLIDEFRRGPANDLSGSGGRRGRRACELLALLTPHLEPLLGLAGRQRRQRDLLVVQNTLRHHRRLCSRVALGSVLSDRAQSHVFRLVSIAFSIRAASV
jgi:hypothetical protein